MTEYHKIHSLYERDERGKMIFGKFARPEFEYLKDCAWEFTEKVDGTNIRVIWSGTATQKLIFQGKTDSSQIPSLLINRLRELFENNMLDAFSEAGEAEVVLYGEGFGAGIQKAGALYSGSQDLVLFDVRVGDWWLERDDVEDCAGRLGIGVVPIVSIGPLQSMHNMVEIGFRSHWGDFMAEGIVARPVVPLRARNGDRIITKLKHKDFALRARVEALESREAK